MSNGTVNKVILIGNLGRDPEIRATQNGKEMAAFSIATSESWVDKLSGTRSEKTEWHNIVVFNDGLVKLIKDYVKKGNKVYIEGTLRTRKWVDQNNNERYITEVVLQNFNSVFSILDSKGSQPIVNNQEMKKEQQNPYENFDQETENELIDDEIPF
ncbi:single-stranded DNA-binding protein [Wolbachia endosymbiont of Pentidionis agamae]|uniref:single-stranded DNA-binding protein n=1 Tax=Wolbachia endosymbiont of Pentidionis agamae TaxID=3110435 RepID=UPI002FD3FC46